MLDCRVPFVLVPLRQTVQVDCDHGLHWSIQDLHILAGILSLYILYLEGKSPFLMRERECWRFNTMLAARAIFMANC